MTQTFPFELPTSIKRFNLPFIKALLLEYDNTGCDVDDNSGHKGVYYIDDTRYEFYEDHYNSLYLNIDGDETLLRESNLAKRRK